MALNELATGNVRFHLKAVVMDGQESAELVSVFVPGTAVATGRL